jgi:hypothetical protein
MYTPLNRNPLAHSPEHYVTIALSPVAEEIFETRHWTTRALAVELANEINWRQGPAARRAVWDAHTGDDDNHPWKFRLALCNALAELGITRHRICLRKS